MPYLKIGPHLVFLTAQRDVALRDAALSGKDATFRVSSRIEGSDASREAAKLSRSMRVPRFGEAGQPPELQCVTIPTISPLWIIDDPELPPRMSMFHSMVVESRPTIDPVSVCWVCERVQVLSTP